MPTLSRYRFSSWGGVRLPFCSSALLLFRIYALWALVLWPHLTGPSLLPLTLVSFAHTLSSSLTSSSPSSPVLRSGPAGMFHLLLYLPALDSGRGLLPRGPAAARSRARLLIQLSQLFVRILLPVTLTPRSRVCLFSPFFSPPARLLHCGSGHLLVSLWLLELAMPSWELFAWKGYVSSSSCSPHLVGNCHGRTACFVSGFREPTPNIKITPVCG